MEAVVSILVGLMTASAVYLLLRAHTFPVVLGAVAARPTRSTYSCSPAAG